VIFLNTQMDLFILKIDVEKFTSTNKKTLHLIFNITEKQEKTVLEFVEWNSSSSGCSSKHLKWIKLSVSLNHWLVVPRSFFVRLIVVWIVTGVDVTCEACQLTMRKIPDTSYHYSDHEGVAAVFTVKRNVTGMSYVLIVHCAQRLMASEISCVGEWASPSAFPTVPKDIQNVWKMGAALWVLPNLLRKILQKHLR